MAETDQPEEVLAFANWALERELTAREIVARGAGLALIELSSVLEAEQAVLDRSVDPLGIILVAYAARSRRLLRSAYRLLDANEGSEAVGLLRTMSEYTIVAQWLKQNPDKMRAWAMADHDKREYVIGRVRQEIGDTMPEAAAALDSQRDELRADRTKWTDASGEPKQSIPSLEGMAAEIGLGFAYQMAYRLQSQYNVHATTLAVDACYQQAEGGRLRLLPAPASALRGYDQYQLGAHLLRDMLATTNAHVRSFLWTTGLEGISAALGALQTSDPRKTPDARRHLIDRAASSAGGDAKESSQ